MKSHQGCMIFAPTISILENHITKAYNYRQTSLVWLQTTFTMIQIQRPWPWLSVNTLARTELIKGCNPSRYSLALKNEFPMGLFNVFSSKNGMRNTRWWESKVCSIRSGFAEIRDLLSRHEWNLVPILISLPVQNHLSVQLIDVVTTYPCGSLDSDMYGSRWNLCPNRNANATCIV